MLRTASIVLCLAAPFAAAAAKPVLDNENKAYLQTRLLTNGTLQIGPVASGRNDGHLQQLDPASVRWGGGGANELRANDTAGGSDAAKDRQAGIREMKAEAAKEPVDAAVETQRKDLVAENRMGDSRQSGGHSMLGASDRATLHDPPPPRDGGLGSESERTFVAPHVLERGTVTIKGRFAGCVVGQRYAGMQFAANGRTYELKDVVISNCSKPGAGSTDAAPMEEVTFVYGKVRVKGWEPEKKE